MYFIGAAYADASRELTQFVNKTSLPFLPTPMGKGVVSDLHPQCVSAARSRSGHFMQTIFFTKIYTIINIIINNSWKNPVFTKKLS